MAVTDGVGKQFACITGTSRRLITSDFSEKGKFLELTKITHLLLLLPSITVSVQCYSCDISSHLTSKTFITILKTL